MQTHPATLEPVACLDLSQDLDDVWNAINAMLKNSPIEEAEEWVIHDYEGFEGYGTDFNYLLKY